MEARSIPVSTITSAGTQRCMARRARIASRIRGGGEHGGVFPDGRRLRGFRPLLRAGGTLYLVHGTRGEDPTEPRPRP